MPKQKHNKTIYKKKRRPFVFLLKIIGIAAVLAFLFGSIMFIWFFKDLPRPEKFTEGEITQSTKIYDRTGEIILYEIFGEEKRTLIPFEDIPLHLKQAMVATEDKSFYTHQGVDIKGILRAILYDLKIKDVSDAQGASTISQQLIKNYFLNIICLDNIFSISYFLLFYYSEIPVVLHIFLFLLQRFQSLS